MRSQSTVFAPGTHSRNHSLHTVCQHGTPARSVIIRVAPEETFCQGQRFQPRSAIPPSCLHVSISSHVSKSHQPSKPNSRPGPLAFPSSHICLPLISSLPITSASINNSQSVPLRLHGALCPGNVCNSLNSIARSLRADTASHLTLKWREASWPVTQTKSLNKFLNLWINNSLLPNSSLVP